MTRVCSVALLLCFFFSLSNAQGEVRTYDRFVVVQQNGDRIEGRDGTLSATQFKGFLLNGSLVDIQKSTIKTLFVQTGTNAGSYALYGALFGLGVGAFAVVLQAADPNAVEESPSTPVIAIVACTAGGALIGALVGSQYSDWRIEPVVASLPIPGNDFQNNVYALRFSINF